MFFSSFIRKSCPSDNTKPLKGSSHSLPLDQMPPGRGLGVSASSVPTPLPSADGFSGPSVDARARVFKSQGTLSSKPGSHGQVYYRDAAKCFFTAFNSGLFTLWSNGLSNPIYTGSAFSAFIPREVVLPLPGFPLGSFKIPGDRKQPHRTEAGSLEPGGWALAAPCDPGSHSRSHPPHLYSAAAFSDPGAPPALQLHACMYMPGVH